MLDVIAIGGATRDITFITDKGKVVETPEDPACQRLLGFEYGAKIRSEEVKMNFGGGASNAAATFAKLGLSVAVLARLGDDENGRSIIGNLEKRGIGTELVQKDAGASSGFSFVVVDANGRGERVIFAHKGAGARLGIPKEELTDAGWLYVSTLADSWEENLADLVDIVGERGIKLAWNPGESEIAGGKEKLAAMLAATELLIVNRDEAIELVQGAGTGLDSEELGDPIRLIREIAGWGPRMVALTEGKEGAYLFAEGVIHEAPAHIAEQVDTTGAGDAFGSGLLAGYLLTGEAGTALKYGILNSGGTVREYGAQNGILTRDEVEALLDAVTVDRIN